MSAGLIAFPLVDRALGFGLFAFGCSWVFACRVSTFLRRVWLNDATTKMRLVARYCRLHDCTNTGHKSSAGFYSTWVNAGSVGGSFICASILVSVSFCALLLSVFLWFQPLKWPNHATAISLREFATRTVGIFLLVSVYRGPIG